MKVSYRTKIVDVESVEFLGELSYGCHTGDSDYWHIKEGGRWRDIDIWLEKFLNRRVKITIIDADIFDSDESDMVRDDDEEEFDNILERE